MSNLTFREVVGILWRRRWWVLVPAFFGLIAGFIVLQHLPALYRASTLVLVEPPKVPDDYVNTTVTTSMQDRLKTIEQQITNRNNLERIVTELGLYGELTRDGGIGGAVAQARKALTLEVQGTRIFQIYFKGPDPETVARAANLITDLFIQENLKLREDQAEGTTAFLTNQLQKLKVQLEEQERRVARFKLEYMGALPEQRESNVKALEALQAKLEINIDALDKAEMRKLYVQRELSLARQEPSAVPALPTTPQELERLRGELARLRARYTEEHPEVVRAKEVLARMEEQHRSLPVGPSPNGSKGRQYPMELAGGLHEVELEIQGLKAERERILGDIARYQTRLERTPFVETQLLDLSRDYNNVKESYDDLLSKRLEAQIAEDLEQQRQTEQFTVLERAVAPKEPYAPNTYFVLALGLGVGCAFGVGLAFLRQETDHTYHNAESLQEAFPAIPVLGVVPALEGSARLTAVR